MNFGNWFGYVWLPGLVAFQSIPGTGALRTVFLLIGIGHTLKLSLSDKPVRLALPRSEGWLLMLLIVWLLIQNIAFSADSRTTLQNFMSEWLKLLLMVGLGVQLARVACANTQSARWIMAGLFAGHFLHVIVTLVRQGWSLATLGRMAVGPSILGDYDLVSPFVTGAFGFLLAEAVLRVSRLRWLPMSNSWLAVMIVATVVSQGMLQAKAGLLVMLIMLLVAGIAVSARGGGKMVLLACALCSVLLIAGTLATSDRWSGVFATVADEIKSPTSIPMSSDIGSVPYGREESAWLRLTWARQGIQGILANPLGIGYGANAFGRYLESIGGPSGFVSSHSGWIDFALANGIVGLVLLLALFAAVFRTNWHSYQSGSVAGLAAVLVLANFVVRSAVDGVLFGSRMTGFSLVASMLWVYAYSMDRLSEGKSARASN
jgi:hypothetical protein